MPSGPGDFPPEAVVDYETSKARPGYAYTAMVFNETALNANNGIVMVGDGSSTTCNDEDALPSTSSRKRRATAENREAFNGKLKSDASYTAFTRAFIPTGDGQVEYTSSPLLEAVVTSLQDGNVSLGIVVGVVVALLVCSVLIVVAIMVWRRRHCNIPTNSQKDDKEDNVTISMVQGSSLNMGFSGDGQAPVSPSMPTLSTTSLVTVEHDTRDLKSNVQEYEVPLDPSEESWEIPWDKLMLGKTILGEGNFGEVREGVVWLKNKVIKVAVKSLKDAASLMDEKDFMDEFGTMTKIGKHPNIVTLIGACKHDGTLYVALELIPHGNLRSFLRQKRREDGSGNRVSISEQLMQFAKDVANGMRHIEDIGIIHRDLAARNILLGEGYVAKVSDFGLSRDEDIYVKKSKTRIPVRWMPPESIKYSTYTTKSDVWSFGVLLWEIGALGGTPYAKIDSKDLVSLLTDGYRMPKPDKCKGDMYDVMMQCWKFEADFRPSFRELHRTLSRMLETNQTYMTVEVYENVKLAPINLDRDDR